MPVKNKAYFLHPLAEKSILKGHPWITKDQYTESYPKEQFFLSLKSLQSPQGIPMAQAINDPDHPKIKARVWSLDTETLGLKSFQREFSKRLDLAISKREKIADRENIYLAFGEADSLPGFYLLDLGQVALVQYSCLAWKKLWPKVSAGVASKLGKPIFLQERLNSKRVTFFDERLRPLPEPIGLNVVEFGVTYECYLGKSYDIGLYTDMASIRQQLKKFLPNEGRLLNLFSYTGAFSLFAARAGMKTMSIDLSKAALDQFKKNLELNEFSLEDHQCVQSSVTKALKKVTGQFDFIICDPPSFSSDGKKSMSALSSYEELLPQMEKILAPKGRILVLLNTHKIKKAQFKSKLSQITKLRVIAEFGLGEDCPVVSGFPEGNYLKGILLSST